MIYGYETDIEKHFYIVGADIDKEDGEYLNIKYVGCKNLSSTAEWHCGIYLHTFAAENLSITFDDACKIYDAFDQDNNEDLAFFSLKYAK